jgi:hypothetical protein
VFDRELIASRPYGNNRCARLDGRCCAPSVGPTHGPHRHFASVWSRSASAPITGTQESFRSLRRRIRTHGAASKQHGDGPHGRLFHIGRAGWASSCTGNYARRECWDDSDCSNPFLQHIGCRSCTFRCWPSCIPRRCPNLDKRPRPCGNRFGTDAARTSHSARYAGSCRECPKRTGSARRDHRRSGVMRARRGRSHLGSTFKCSDCALDHVARLFTLHHANGRPRARVRCKPWQRNQSGGRRRSPRRPRELPAPGRKLAQSARGSRGVCAVPRAHRRRFARYSARRGQDDRHVSRRVQRWTGSRFYRVARSALLAAGKSLSSSQAVRRSFHPALPR